MEKFPVLLHSVLHYLPPLVQETLSALQLHLQLAGLERCSG